MIPTVIVPAVAQLILPLGPVAWVAFGRHPYRARWWLLIALAWTGIAAIGVAGLWLALPWYLYLIHAGLLAAAILTTWHRVHLDRTRALEPMERTAAWVATDIPETYPSGL